VKRRNRGIGASFFVFLVVSFVLFSFASRLEASGFALIEQSVTGLGNAYAGGSAGAEDAATIYYNPAGMTRLKGTQILFGGHAIMPSAKFNNEGSTRRNGISLGFDNGSDAGVTAVVPNFYLSHNLNNNIVVGLGINSPFGLITDYGNTWVGRYHATKTDMLSININPSIAYKVNEHLSFGAGVSAQYIKVQYDSMIDNLLVGGRTDGSVSHKGDSWGFGFNAGMLVEVTKDARIGLAYRSSVKQLLNGTADFTNLALPLISLGYVDTKINAELTMPDTVSLSGYYSFNDQWSIMGDVTWTNWSDFKEVRIKYTSGAPDGLTTTDWKDSWRYSLGLTYRPDPAWAIRTGIAFDKSPVRDAEHRTPRIPDADRLWLACGVSYAASKTVNFDLGYVHIFVNDPQVNLIATATNENRLRGNLRGTIDAQVNIVSAQMRLTF